MHTLLLISEISNPLMLSKIARLLGILKDRRLEVSHIECNTLANLKEFHKPEPFDSNIL